MNGMYQVLLDYVISYMIGGVYNLAWSIKKRG